jgi:predicted RNase H-like nuclease (RuvC/YqgF family)
MWIRIAEAIDWDAVNDPALPPVSDEIQAEVEIAEQEQQIQWDIEQAQRQGEQTSAVRARIAALRQEQERLKASFEEIRMAIERQDSEAEARGQPVQGLWVVDWNGERVLV